MAFYTLGERKVIAAVQRRAGPDVVGFEGLLQPLADGVKLLFKGVATARGVNFWLFTLAPVALFLAGLFNWLLVPLGAPAALDWDGSLFILLAVGTLGSYGVFFAGWATESLYALFGSLRAVAQLLSYEVALGTTALFLALTFGTANLVDLALVHGAAALVWSWPFAAVFFLCILAETNRVPFDLAEAEAELVAGYNVEYSGFTFALFFLGEYSAMLALSGVFAALFGGALPGGGLWGATVVVAAALVWLRALLPRYRYDQLLALGWNFVVPVTLGLVGLYAAAAGGALLWAA